MPSRLDAPAIRGDRKRGPLSAANRVVPGFTRVRLASEIFAEARRVDDLNQCQCSNVLGAEIGVADGRYSLTLCESVPDLQLLCVDPWMPYKGNTRGGPVEQHDGNYQLARERLAPYAPGVRLVKAFSVDAARDVPLGSLDFCYLDGNHSFDWIMVDLITWAQRVRSGGIVAGHDFYEFRDAGVVEAVTAYTSWHGITDWHLTDEREPSFWWVKP